MARNWKVRGQRECARPECDRVFDVTYKTKNDTECLPHKRATARMKVNEPKAPRVPTLPPLVTVYTDAEARQLMREVRLEPTVPYLGFEEPWPSRCHFCGQAHHPTLRQVAEHKNQPGYTRRFCSCRVTNPGLKTARKT